MLEEVIFSICQKMTESKEINVVGIVGFAIMFTILYVVYCMLFETGGNSVEVVILNIVIPTMILGAWGGRYLYGFIAIASVIFLAWLSVRIKDHIEEKKHKKHS